MKIAITLALLAFIPLTACYDMGVVEEPRPDAIMDTTAPELDSSDTEVSCEEQFASAIPNDDSDNDGTRDEDDLYVCCEEAPLTYGVFAQHFYKFIRDNVAPYAGRYQPCDTTQAVQVFTDVPPGHPNFEAFYCLDQWLQVWFPTSDGEVGVDNIIHRWEPIMWASHVMSVPELEIDGWVDLIPFEDLRAIDLDLYGDTVYDVTKFAEAGILPTDAENFGVEENATECMLDMFDKACELSYCESWEQVCSTTWIPDADSDGDTVENQFDDYVCCNEGEVTRAQFSVIVYDFLIIERGKVCPDDVEEPFPDVPESHRASREMNCMKYWQFISDYSDGFFRPENPILRGDLAVSLALAIDLQSPSEGPELPFLDVELIDYWYTSIYQLWYHGLIPEREIFRPLDLTTECLLNGILEAASQ